MPQKNNTHYQHLQKKWSERHAHIKKSLREKHKDALSFVSNRFPFHKIQAGSLGGLMLLSAPVFMHLPNNAQQAEAKELFVKGINALMQIATVVTVIALIVMGFRLMTSAGNATALTETKKRAKWIVVGYVCILAAWLVVYTILNTLVYSEFNMLGKL